MKRHLKLVAIFFMLAATFDIAIAQDFPSRTVRITTPYSSGSGPEIVARFIADGLSKIWNQSVVVEAKPGGDGVVAINAVKSSPRDGHDLLVLGDGHLAVIPNLKTDISYDVEKDFLPITMSHRAPYFVVVSTQSPFHTLSDLIAAAKTNVSKISYGTPYVSSPATLGAAWLAHLTNTEMLQVPFKETTQLFLSVARRDVDWALGSYATMKALIDSNMLRLLAVAQDKRSPDRPDVPTVAEAGGPKDYVVQVWSGYVVMSGTPLPIVQRLNHDILQVFSEPSIKARILATGSEVIAGSTQQMVEQIRIDSARYAKIISAIRK